MTIDRMEIEAVIRSYIRSGGRFIFMKFSKLTGIPYDDVLVVSDYFAPYSKWVTREPIASFWPSGAVSALAAVCTMEANRRKGLPL